MVKKEDNTKIASILSYFLVGIIWFFVDEELKKSKEVKFHVKQALNLIIINILIGFVFRILFFGILGPMMFIIGIVNLVILVFWVIGLINAIKQDKKEIPIIGEFANKYLTF